MATLIGTTGNDRIVGTADADIIFGDPYTTGNDFGIEDGGVLSSGRGGNDRIDGLGGGLQWIYGDTWQMEGTARGGNDYIEGGDGDNVIRGEMP